MSHLLSACSTLSATDAQSPVVWLMALGGPMQSHTRAKQGVAALQALGFAVENQPVLYRRHSRFAGIVPERAADLNQLIDPAVSMPDLILATRGGYGAAQLLEHIDFDRLCPRLKQHGTVLIGYSDNTALQLALLAKGGVVTLSGPMLYGDFAAQSVSTFTFSWLQQVLTADQFSLRVDTPHQWTTAATRLSGTLWGGNLTVLTSLVGTPWMPKVKNGILFIEDVGEDVYKVDRMLTQLRLAGILGQQRAILFGHFSEQHPDSYDPHGYTMEVLAQDVFTQLRNKVPVFTGLPIGHVHDIVPMPIGGQGELVSDAAGFTLTVHGYPTLKRLPTAWWMAPSST